MKVIDIIQNWSGYFTYPIYDENENLSEDEEERVDFKMSINLHHGSFTGTSEDEESKSLFDKLPTVKGFVEKNLVSFTKQYPCLYYIDKQGKLTIDPQEKHPIIQYTGFLNETEDEIIGEWEMGESPGEGDWGEFVLKKES